MVLLSTVHFCCFMSTLRVFSDEESPDVAFLFWVSGLLRVCDSFVRVFTRVQDSCSTTASLNLGKHVSPIDTVVVYRVIRVEDLFYRLSMIVG